MVEIDKSKLCIYLASPFFNEDQNNTVSKVEELLEKYNFKYFSPRKEGGVYNKDATPEERAIQAQKIFEGNLAAMAWADLAICNIDDRDTGTAWEYGWFNGNGTPAVTFSGHNYGCNIMLAQSGVGHCPTLEDLEKFLKILSENYADTESQDIMGLVEVSIAEAGFGKRGHADE